MISLKKRVISLVTLLGLIFSMFTVPVSAAYENTHVNTGESAFDILSVALTQLGYTEGANNETKYGAWYPMNYNPWCAMFVSWCAEQAGIPTSVIPKHASCDVGVNWFKRNSVWHDSAYHGGTYTPMAGDIIYFGVVGDSDHVGYVTGVKNGYVHTIEGNASDKVMQKSYAIGSSKILGYGVPAYNQIIASGSCGDDAIWLLSGTGVLAVGGSGPMYDYTDGAQPWLNYRSMIKAVYVNANVTSIGDFSFCVMPNLTKLVIADTVTRIGIHAFSSCTSLANVTLPSSVTKLDTAAFANTAIKSITLGENVSSIGHAAFLSCSKLTNATVLNSNAVFSTSVFDGTAANFTLTGYHSTTAAAYAAAYGHTFVSLNGEAPETEAPETEAPETEAPETEAPETEPIPTATIALSDAKGMRGEVVEVEIFLENTEPISSVSLFNLTYSSSALTFAGFADYEDIEVKCLSASYDEDSREISLVLAENEVLEGSLGKILFTVKDDAQKGIYSIGITPVITADEVEFNTARAYSEILVTDTLLGDINTDGTVDINDARLLFQHSILPDVYPIDYTGSLDFTKNGTVDIEDAKLLFRYSMLPELYPLA